MLKSQRKRNSTNTSDRNYKLSNKAIRNKKKLQRSSQSNFRVIKQSRKRQQLLIILIRKAKMTGTKSLIKISYLSKPKKNQ